MFPSLTTMLPFIYTVLIVYPFLFGYGLFSKGQKLGEDNQLVFVDFNLKTNGTNIYYKRNMFAVKVESEVVMNDEDMASLSRSDLEYDDLYSYVNDLRMFLEKITKDNTQGEKLYCIVSSNAFNLLLDDMLEDNEQIKFVDVKNSYGILYNDEKNIPTSIEDEETGNDLFITKARYLYHKILDVYPNFPDCYVK